MEKSWNCVFEFLWEPCHCCLTVERFTHGQTVSLKIEVMHCFISFKIVVLYILVYWSILSILCTNDCVAYLDIIMT